MTLYTIVVERKERRLHTTHSKTMNNRVPLPQLSRLRLEFVVCVAISGPRMEGVFFFVCFSVRCNQYSHLPPCNAIFHYFMKRCCFAPNERERTSRASFQFRTFSGASIIVAWRWNWIVSHGHYGFSLLSGVSLRSPVNV